MKSETYRDKNEEEKLNIIRCSVIGWIEEPSCKLLIEKFLDQYKEAFFKSIASSRYHHNYEGGLLDHSMEVYQIAGDIASNFPSYNRSFEEKLYENCRSEGAINTDILYTSAFLHDIGDIFQYQKAPPLKTMINLKDENGKDVLDADGKKVKVPKPAKYPWERSSYSKVIGHFGNTLLLINQLVQGTNMPYCILDGINHVIAAHHGDCPQFGSLVQPNSPEAWIVYAADQTSAKVGGE